MKKITTLTLAIFAVVLFALPSQAASPVRLGEKSFERAWWRLMNSNDREAQAQFSEAANAFAEALAEDPRGRTVGFPSNLTKAGMSFYFSKRYDESVTVMEEAFSAKERIWESAIISAASYAHLGNQVKAVEWLQKFRDMLAGQRELAEVANKQLDDLIKGSVSLAEVAAALDEAVLKQFHFNMTYSQQKDATSNSRCGSAYWWRYSKQPCYKRGKGLN